MDVESEGLPGVPHYDNVLAVIVFTHPRAKVIDSHIHSNYITKSVMIRLLTDIIRDLKNELKKPES